MLGFSCDANVHPKESHRVEVDNPVPRRTVEKEQTGRHRLCTMNVIKVKSVKFSACSYC